MEDAAIAVLWPSDDGTSWTISHRAAGGHSQPEFSPSIVAKSLGRFQLVPGATSSTRTNTIVSFIRRLTLPSDQILFPSINAKYVDLERANSQKIIYAFSSNRPPTTDEDAPLTVRLCLSLRLSARLVLILCIDSDARYEELRLHHD